MKGLKNIFKCLAFLLFLPVLYLIISLITTYIPVNNKISDQQITDTIYLRTNGIHLDIALPEHLIDASAFSGLMEFHSETRYYSFGWGDENFYINTPEWSDLTAATAFKAAFLKSPSLVHVTRYDMIQSDWRTVPVSKSQLNNVNRMLSETFSKDSHNQVVLLAGKGYSSNDDFYRANGHYHMFNTCNSWANDIFKKSSLKACLWTPFDFGLLGKYEKTNITDFSEQSFRK